MNSRHQKASDKKILNIKRHQTYEDIRPNNQMSNNKIHQTSNILHIHEKPEEVKHK